MLDVTSFLVRWLYLCKLVGEISEIQTQPLLTHNPPQPPRGHVDPYGQYFPSRESWKDEYRRGILSLPPGSQRQYVMDAMRLDLVHKLAQHIRVSDEVVKRYARFSRKQEQERKRIKEDDDDDPYWDADLEIVRQFEEATSDVGSGGEVEDSEEREALLVISKNGTDYMDSVVGTKPQERPKEEEEEEQEETPSHEELNNAHHSLAAFRDYLPQLISAVLKSPAALQPTHLDPVRKLRQLLLTKCVQDANWGVELCWLLEAEVGRQWKTLFEHRQQTGKRLIIILPAEKAQVLARIGSEKREAFDLLQDAEAATAYGYTVPEPTGPTLQVQEPDPDLEPTPSRLPSSLSLRRCSHFGDTMQFVDRLTDISSQMRSVPHIQRNVSTLCTRVKSILILNSLGARRASYKTVWKRSIVG